MCSLAALALLCAPVVARASYAGTLDPSFGTRGVTVAQIIPGSPNFADSLALQPDGKIVVGAYASAQPSAGGIPPSAAIARLTPDGAFDPHFGNGGRVALSGVSGFAPSSVPFDERPPPPVRLKVLLTGDEHILVLGSSLIRLSSDGRLDHTFGSSGTAQLPAAFSPAGFALAPNGAIVIVGDRTLPVGARMPSGAMAGAVVRLTADGLADPTFGSSGSGMVTLPPVSDSKGRPHTAIDYRGIVVAASGRITVAGVGSVSAEGLVARDGLLARLTAGGSLDPAFGQGGQTLVETYGGVSSFDSFDPNALLLRSDERVLVGAADCARYGRCFPRFVVFTPDGVAHPPEGLGFGGCSPPYCEQSLALAPLPDGGVLGAAWEGDLLLERFDPNLNPVRSFGTGDSGEDVLFGGAIAQLPAGSQTGGNMLVVPGGKVVVAGSVPTSDGSRGILVARMFGLSPTPRPRLGVHNRRTLAGQRSVSALLDCRSNVSCSGQAVLGVPRRGRRSRTVLARGPFNIASKGSGLVVMAVTRAGRRILHGSRLTAATLTLSMAKTNAVALNVLVPRLLALRRGTAAPSALEPLASDVSGFDGDGRRYVFFIQGSTLHVLDTVTQREYSARVPAGCADNAQRALSFPMVLLSCEAQDVPVHDVLVDVAAQRVRQLPTYGGQYDWGNIGRVWLGPIAAPFCANFHVCEDYLDWHTGAVRRIDTPPAPQPVMGALNEVLARNLDSADLAPMAACPPLQPTDPYQSLVAYPRLYEPPYLIFGQAIEPFNGGAPQTAPGLWLGGCGTTETIALDVSARRLIGPGQPGDQLGAGIASWYSPADATVSLYEIRRKRRLTWAAPGARAAFSVPAAIAHTKDAAIVATATHQLCTGEGCNTDSWTLYLARLR